jgi:hypothetical protein
MKVFFKNSQQFSPKNKCNQIYVNSLKPVLTQHVSNMWLSFSNGVYFMSCFHIYKELENSAGKNFIISKCKKLKQSKSFKSPDFIWNNHTLQWDKFNVNDFKQMSNLPYIPVEDVHHFILPIVNRARKTKTKKEMLLTKFNLQNLIKDIKVPIECSLLDDFSKVCPYPIELQYRIEKYKIDAYIPRLKIAIEIDENGHSSYNPNEEKEYETLLRDMHIICIRFDPTTQTIFDLIKLVWTRTLSPDYKSFVIRDNL